MKKLPPLSFLLVCLLLAGTALAQEGKVTGVIIDSMEKSEQRLRNSLDRLKGAVEKWVENTDVEPDESKDKNNGKKKNKSE